MPNCPPPVRADNPANRPPAERQPTRRSAALTPVSRLKVVLFPAAVRPDQPDDLSGIAPKSPARCTACRPPKVLAENPCNASRISEPRSGNVRRTGAAASSPCWMAAAPAAAPDAATTLRATICRTNTSKAPPNTMVSKFPVAPNSFGRISCNRSFSTVTNPAPSKARQADAPRHRPPPSAENRCWHSTRTVSDSRCAADGRRASPASPASTAACTKASIRARGTYRRRNLRPPTRLHAMRADRPADCGCRAAAPSPPRPAPQQAPHHPRVGPGIQQRISEQRQWRESAKFRRCGRTGRDWPRNNTRLTPTAIVASAR